MELEGDFCVSLQGLAAERKNRRRALMTWSGFVVAIQEYVAEVSLADAHQVNTLIARAICNCRNDHPAGPIDPEEAKTIAKRIVQHLVDAGFSITHEASSSRNDGPQ